MFMSEDYPGCYTESSCRYERHPMKQTGDCMHVPSGAAMPYTSPPAMPMMAARRFRMSEDMFRYRRDRFPEPSPPLHLGYRVHPTAVARRNERERNRVKHINSTFTTLRQHLPSGGKSRKLSKVETLRSAVRYIRHLQAILEAQGEVRTDDAGDKQDVKGKGKDIRLKVPEISPKSPVDVEIAARNKSEVSSPTGSISSVASSRLSEGRAEPLSPLGLEPRLNTSTTTDRLSSSPTPSEDSCSTLSGSIDNGGSTPPDDFSDLTEWFLWGIQRFRKVSSQMSLW